MTWRFAAVRLGSFCRDRRTCSPIALGSDNPTVPQSMLVGKAGPLAFRRKAVLALPALEWAKHWVSSKNRVVCSATQSMDKRAAVRAAFCTTPVRRRALPTPGKAARRLQVRRPPYGVALIKSSRLRNSRRRRSAGLASYRRNNHTLHLAFQISSRGPGS